MDDREFRGRVRRLKSAIDRELERRRTEGEYRQRYIDLHEYEDYEDIIDAEWVEVLESDPQPGREALTALQNRILALVGVALLVGIALGSLI